MNEKNTLSNHTISIRIGDNHEFLNMDMFTAICDRFLYEEIIDIVAQSPSDKIIYSGMRNKVKFVLHITPKNDSCPV